MGVVIQEFEILPAASPAAAPAPAAAAEATVSPPPARPSEVQRIEIERRQRAVRLFAH
jgi:hypothetical protein